MEEALRHFHPEQTRALGEAFELACKTFEKQRALRSAEREHIARAVISAAKPGPLEADRLATRAILSAVLAPSQQPQRP